jgi:alpha-L-rhamnosidase
VADDGRIQPDMQSVYVLAIAAELVAPDRRPAVVEHLVRLIGQADNRLDTGFLSVPYLLDVLWEHGHAELARALLLQDTPPPS